MHASTPRGKGERAGPLRPSQRAGHDPQHATDPARRRRARRHRLRHGPGRPAQAHRAGGDVLRADPDPDGGFWWRQPCLPCSNGGVGARPRVLTVAVRVVVVDDEPMVCAHLADNPRLRRRPGGRRGGPRRRGGGRGRPARPPRCRAHGPAHARGRRAHGDRADQQALRPAGGGRAGRPSTPTSTCCGRWWPVPPGSWSSRPRRRT